MSGWLADFGNASLSGGRVCLPLYRPLLHTVLRCFKGGETATRLILFTKSVSVPLFHVFRGSGFLIVQENHRERFVGIPGKRETVKQIKNNCLIAMA